MIGLYIRELGCGWFGRVVEGEASLIHNTEEKTPVLVKILREEASPSEHLHFLHEVRPYRDVVHPNIVRLLGRCLESDPFLLIMEHSINVNTRLLLFGWDCLTYPMVLPETLLCTEATIETKEITKEANVWAFGIILWEIFELGKLPYEELTNEEVLQKVLIERTVQLLTPTKEFPVKRRVSVHLRPSMDKIENFLTRLYNDCHNLKTLETSFEERWNSLQPKSIETKLLGTELLPLKFENDFSERSDSHNYSSDGERFSSFEMSYDMYSKSIGSHLRKSTADAASVLSDSDLPQLEDDHGNHLKDNIMPEHVSDAVRDFDMVLANQLSNPSRQSHKFQLNGKKNSTNPFVAESCNQEMPKDAHSNIPIASHYYTEVSSNLNLQKLLPGQNANELKRLNNNNNEFQLISDEINRHNDGPEMMSTENSPDSINANKVVDFSVVKNELAVNNLEKNTMLTESKPVHSEDEINLNNQKLSDNLSAVPDIIVHESPSIIESSHDENENMVQEITSAGSVYFEPSRPFRFVFKDESVPEIDDENHVKISEETNSSQNTPNGTDSSLEKFPDMKYKPRSQHLTSTPLKNEKDNNLSYSSSFADEDLGNVFYGNSPSDNLLNNECTTGSAEEFFSANCEILKDTPASNEKSLENIRMKKFNESLCNETTIRSDVSTKIIPSNVLVEKSIASVDFTSAQSTFNTEHVNNTLPISKHDSNSQIIINNHVPSFVSEMNESNSSECLDKDIKLEEIKNSQKPDKYSVQHLESTNQEDIGCFDFGEPVTP
ncbi:hypothetical protein CEXT_548391 [Caerostris extrusa]|uniref:Protein kinase domain-containing protein n=1 Tax=Caerostris extrusa TaxID=172846 RepID=A0AAV4WK93_CAEEX|nr:hypothetical protein CEXT_548391 [Caerostris extrusa]